MQRIDEIKGVSTEVRGQMKALLLILVSDGRDLPPGLDITNFSEDIQTRLGSVIWSIAKSIATSKEQSKRTEEATTALKPLPNKIKFPYSRHSSLPELRHLVDTFKPKDIWPCTVDIPHWIKRQITMRGLFGPHCSGAVFEHDGVVAEFAKDAVQPLRKRLDTDSQNTDSSIPDQPSSPRALTSTPNVADATTSAPAAPQNEASMQHSSQIATVPRNNEHSSPVSTGIAPEAANLQVPKRTYAVFREDEPQLDDEGDDPDIEGDSQASALSARAYETRLRAFRAVEGGHDEWSSIGLISTTGNHSTVDDELG